MTVRDTIVSFPTREPCSSVLRHDEHVGTSAASMVALIAVAEGDEVRVR
jgi:hypothetical protein